MLYSSKNAPTLSAGPKNRMIDLGATAAFMMQYFFFAKLLYLELGAGDGAETGTEGHTENRTVIARTLFTRSFYHFCLSYSFAVLSLACSLSFDVTPSLPRFLLVSFQPQPACPCDPVLILKSHNEYKQSFKMRIQI